MAMNAVVDERTLREIYLTGFEIAIKEGKPGFVMTAYNRVNGVYANESRHLLGDILRGEWGFDGAVVTDWGGSNSIVEGVREGMNLEMPAAGDDSPCQLVKAVKDGTIDEKIIDERVDQLLDFVLAENKSGESSFDAAKQHQAAEAAAEKCRPSVPCAAKEPRAPAAAEEGRARGGYRRVCGALPLSGRGQQHGQRRAGG